MDRNDDRITWKTLLGFLVLAGFLALVTSMADLVVGANHLPLITRLAAAFFGVVVLSRLVRVVRGATLIGEIPALDAASASRTRGRIDPMLLQIAEECRHVRPWRAMPRATLERLHKLGLQPDIDAARDARRGERFTWQDVERAVAQHELSE